MNLFIQLLEATNLLKIVVATQLHCSAAVRVGIMDRGLGRAAVDRRSCRGLIEAANFPAQEQLKLVQGAAAAHPRRHHFLAHVLKKADYTVKLLHELLLGLGYRHELAQRDAGLLLLRQQLAHVFHAGHVELHRVEERLVLGGRALHHRHLFPTVLVLGGLLAVLICGLGSGGY